MIELLHPFIRRCIGRNALLDNVNKFNTFANKLEKQAKEFGKEDDKEINSYKGWGFELFGEALVRMHAFDKRVGVSDYRLVEEDEDTGVDGYGTGTNGNPATVQFKYRQANYVLTTNNDHLSNFAYASLRTYKVTEPSNMLIITCGEKLHWHTENNMLPGVRCLNREKIRVLVDDNKAFWDEFRNSWENAVSSNPTVVEQQIKLPRPKVGTDNARMIVQKLLNGEPLDRDEANRLASLYKFLQVD